MNARYERYMLSFKVPAGTSRGVLNEKETWFIYLREEGEEFRGECNLFRGLSCDDVADYESVLQLLCQRINSGEGLDVIISSLRHFPSILFGLECAYLALQGKGTLYPSKFTDGQEGILINGLIWMGEVDFMKQQINEKLQAGFKVLKLKIGSLDWNQEIDLIGQIRKSYSPSDLEIRVDANGAFTMKDALLKLNQLAKLGIHSIEQPIKAGQIKDMFKLCVETPLPIALDEELIGLNEPHEPEELLDQIKPHYLILKPALIGGFSASQRWIDAAQKRNIAWWITSALESNVGLSAIAQWTYAISPLSYHGLGTGSLFTNNTVSNLQVIDGKLWMLNEKNTQ